MNPPYERCGLFSTEAAVFPLHCVLSIGNIRYTMSHRVEASDNGFSFMSVMEAIMTKRKDRQPHTGINLLSAIK